MPTPGSAAMIDWQLVCSPWWWLDLRNTCLLLWSKEKDGTPMHYKLSTQQFSLWQFLVPEYENGSQVCSPFSETSQLLAGTWRKRILYMHNSHHPQQTLRGWRRLPGRTVSGSLCQNQGLQVWDTIEAATLPAQRSHDRDTYHIWVLKVFFVLSSHNILSSGASKDKFRLIRHNLLYDNLSPGETPDYTAVLHSDWL